MGSGEQVATDVAFLSIAGQPSRFSPTDAAFTTQNSDCYLRTSSFLENRRLDSGSFPKILKEVIDKAELIPYGYGRREIFRC